MSLLHQKIESFLSVSPASAAWCRNWPHHRRHLAAIYWETPSTPIGFRHWIGHHCQPCSRMPCSRLFCECMISLIAGVSALLSMICPCRPIQCWPWQTALISNGSPRCRDIDGLEERWEHLLPERGRDCKKQQHRRRDRGCSQRHETLVYHTTNNIGYLQLFGISVLKNYSSMS